MIAFIFTRAQSSKLTYEHISRLQAVSHNPCGGRAKISLKKYFSAFQSWWEWVTRVSSKTWESQRAKGNCSGFSSRLCGRYFGKSLVNIADAVVCKMRRCKLRTHYVYIQLVMSRLQKKHLEKCEELFTLFFLRVYESFHVVLS